MFIPVLIFALAIGAGVAWVWSSAFDTHGPWNSFSWFFIVIFLFAWGGGSWVAPFGPTGWGVAWLPILFMGVFMALLLTAATPRSQRRRRSTDLGPAPRGKSVVKAAKAAELTGIAVTLDLFFWALILVLAGLVLSNFLWRKA